MNTMNNEPKPEMPRFVLKDCALIAIATHKHANTLKEFRDHLEDLSLDSLYYHFWANLLLPRFEEREHINDFASWVRHSLSDTLLNHFQEVNEQNANQLCAILEEADFVFIHDPQPAALLKHCKNREGKWIWRCHIDASHPYRGTWRFIDRFVRLWKGKPVIGGDTGGIRLQVINFHTGFLVNTPEGAALRIRYLFNQKQKIQEMGVKSREFVRENFLLTRQLREHLTLMVSLQHGAVDRIELS